MNDMQDMPIVALAKKTVLWQLKKIQNIYL